MIIDISGGRSKTIATFYEVTKFLANGRFSEVYKAYNKHTHTDVALKIYVGQDEKAEKIAKNEVVILQELEKTGSDYFAVPKGGVRVFKRHPLFAMELGEYTGHDSNKKIISLKDIIPNKELKNGISEVPGFWDFEPFFKFILELCNAVKVLHQHEGVHRDLKHSNILLKKSSSDNYIKPFILDFNTSVWRGKHIELGGTERYLPPEVRTGTRKEAAKADDLWAVAVIIWELIYGFERNFEKECTPHELINFALPKDLISVLLKALLPAQPERFSNADELHSAVESILHHSNDEETGPDPDEIIWANENKNKIKSDIIEVLNVSGELLVSKEIKDNVAFIFSSLSQMETQTFDLKNDIVQLGTKAIPAIIEECFKIPSDSSNFKDISAALADLAVNDRDLAVRTIRTFCVSSDYNVRSMCLFLCEKLSFFPTKLIYNILEDDILYLPAERVLIADLCLKYSNDNDVMMPLNKYMCREYILDTSGSKYSVIRKKIASQMDRLDFDKKAYLIVDDTRLRIWEELPEYRELPIKMQEKVDKGLLELFGDAFASLGSEALDYVKDPGLPSACQRSKLRIASTFIGKLSKINEHAREWLFSGLSQTPANRTLYFAAQRLKDLFSDEEWKVFNKASAALGYSSEEENVDILKVFKCYLDAGGNKERNILYWKGDIQTLNLVEDEIRKGDDLDRKRRILLLLDDYKNKHRPRILNILFENWNILLKADFDLLVDVLCNYDIPNEDMRKKAIKLLNSECGCDDRRIAAVKGLDKILERQ